MTEATAERAALPSESDAEQTAPPENLGPRPRHRVAWLPLAAILGILVGLGMLVAGVTVLLSVISISSDADELAAGRAETEAELAAVREEIGSTQASAVELSDAQTALQDDVDAVITAAEDLMAAEVALIEADNARVGVHDAVIERIDAGDREGTMRVVRDEYEAAVSEVRVRFAELEAALEQYSLAVTALQEALS